MSQFSVELDLTFLVLDLIFCFRAPGNRGKFCPSGRFLATASRCGRGSFSADPQSEWIVVKKLDCFSVVILLLTSFFCHSSVSRMHLDYRRSAGRFAGWSAGALVLFALFVYSLSLAIIVKNSFFLFVSKYSYIKITLCIRVKYVK